MSYETLPTNLVDDVLNSEVNTQRRFVIKDTATGNIINADVVIEEITTLTTSGSEMGSNLTNKQNRIINQHSEDLTDKANKTYVEANDIDSLVALSTSYGYSDPYVPANDGYVSISNGTIFVYGSSATNLSSNTNRVWLANNSGQLSNAVFVRKGSQIVVTSGTAYYCPLT